MDDRQKRINFLEEKIRNLLEENVDDQTRESQRKTNRAYLQYYREELKNVKDENKQKRLKG